ncbi:hypothetical protein BDV93DRAFT_520798 [Ceratobasidium sp. AG-I]|nr:hypothetical protein BDV93DRAFT_520798 [Ceratobasidium sp. AG-I]
MPPPPPPPIPVSTAGRKEDMFAPPPQDWQSWAGTPTNATPGGSNHGLPMKPPSVRGGTQNGSVKPNQSQRAETPTKVPFQNLTLNWSRPTVLQKQMLGPLRVGRDMLVYHGNMKSQAHAILVRCMQVLKQHNLGHNSNGVITVLFIVPQQSTGRLYLNFANQLFSDFDLPCKAMLLPGGGSELAAEIEKMSSERIDILLSTPRVFINHVNGNPNISAHLAKVRMVVYPAAHELVKNEVFLSFQFNSIKKKMQSRSKAPRQIIIAANSPTDEIQTFAMRALNAGYDSVISAGSGDNLAEGSWVDLLRRR